MAKRKYNFGRKYNGWQGFANEVDYWVARIAFMYEINVADFRKKMDEL